MSKMDFLPIILGSDENAYGTLRLLREAYPAVTPLMLCARQLTPTRGSKLPRVELVNELDRDDVFPEALLSILKREGEHYEKLLVIPCSDYYTGLVCRHYEHFEGRIANRFNPMALLDTFDTKDKFYALCEKHGLDYPKTVIVEADKRVSAADTLPFAFPIVVKPENSNASEYLHCTFNGKKKVYFFDTREEYLAMVTQMNASSYRGKLIIQEFIPGGDDAMRVMNSYSGLDGKVRAMCLGQPLLEYYEPSSVGNYAAIVSRSDRALYRKLQGFLEELGYVGFANFDMKYDSRTGRFLLFEINPRLGRSSFFCRAAGINMMRVLVEDTVYGKSAPCIYNENTALWMNVPRGVVRKYVADPALRAEIAPLRATHTLWVWNDMTIARAYRLFRLYLAQYHNFRRYYFDKTKVKGQALSE